MAAQCIGHRVHHGGRRGDGAGLAAALHAERVGEARYHGEVPGEERQIVGARQRVVHERAGQQLPARLVVDRVLGERLADPLRDGAVALALHQERVENAPEIVDRGVADDAHGPGRALDLDLAHVAAVGISHGAGHVVDMAVEPERLGIRPERRIEGSARDLGEARRPVGAGDAVASVREGDILRPRLQQGGGDRAALLHGVLRRAADGVAADRERARAAGAAAVGNQRAVPLPHAYIVQRDAERAGDDLRERGLVPLPRRLAADQQRRRAVRIDAQRHPLVAVAAAGIDVEREPDAA